MSVTSRFLSNLASFLIGGFYMERLQKVIAHAGIASRRKAEQLILEGKVTVNDKVVRELGVKVTGKEKIEVK